MFTQMPFIIFKLFFNISELFFFFFKISPSSLWGWSIQVCLNIMPRWKDISNDLLKKKSIITVYQSVKDYNAISKQYQVHNSSGKKKIMTAVNIPSS